MPQNNNFDNFKNSKLLQKDAIDLLKTLISLPSFSKEEDKTALVLNQFFADRGIPANRLKNNIVTN